MTDEGIRALPNTAPRINRTHKVEHLLQISANSRIVLIRSAPATGKTALMQLLEDELRVQGRQFGMLPIIDTRLKKDGEVKEGAETFDEYFVRSVGRSWVETLSMEQDYLLVMDEAQIIYEDYAGDFWTAVKNLASKGGPGGVRMILFAVYGDTIQTTIRNGRGTPFTPSKTLGADFLELSLAEVVLLISDLSVRVQVHFPDRLAELLHRFTGGHVGMTRAALEAIHQHVKRVAPIADVTIGQLIHFLLSSEMLHSIHVGVRSPPKFGNFNDESKRMLVQILRNGSVTISTADLEVAQDLMERNIVRWSEDVANEARFINEAIQRLAYDALCSSGRPTREAPSLPQFLQQVIPMIRCDFLKENLGVGVGDVLLESVWQMELYRCATASLHARSHISPSVGRIFDSSGQLDFYINADKQWLVEITREGSRLAEHVRRFEPGGLYAEMPCKSRVLLDFRSRRPKRKVVDGYGQVWFIVYARNYETATIVRKGQPDTHISFAGQEMDPQEQMRQLMARVLVMEEQSKKSASSSSRKSPAKGKHHKA